ncbi:VOC family protein [Curtobacterium sp. SP.BCp]|uniref:VOC family protein n=1 Tax=Curtobacterium sp. SP.BCp TaxID=3435230 RepID=UPI003F731436
MDTALAAYCSYRDADAGLAWLTAVGFTVVARQDGDDGRLVHAEARWGEAVLMIGTADSGYVTPPLVGTSTGSGCYLVVDDVDAVFDRAVLAGGTPVFPPEDAGWGARRARVLDLEGHEWSFGTYRPGGA